MRALITRAVAFILRNRIGTWLAIIAATLLIGFSDFEESHWLLARVPARINCAVQATIVSLGAGVALWLILRGVIDRRRIMEDELLRVAELNHTLRNALEVIVLAHYSGADPEHKDMVLECTNRIDQKLKELFPTIGGSRIQMKNGKWEINKS